jgi:HAD superfamily phosphatase (TIGR01668 family)
MINLQHTGGMLEWLRPHQVICTLTEVCGDELRAQGVTGVLLDLDNTLALWRSVTPAPGVPAWLASLQHRGIQACLVTNALSAGRVRPLADCLGIPWVRAAHKPSRRGLRRGLELLGTEPATTAMIGDQLFTDVWGGHRLGLYTILLDPLSPCESWMTRWFHRPLERVVGRTPRHR